VDKVRYRSVTVPFGAERPWLRDTGLLLTLQREPKLLGVDVARPIFVKQVEGIAAGLNFLG
jgi:hypothetical protein